MAHLPASVALERFRVIDLTQVRAGPTACRQLADWGADVIQVQMPDILIVGATLAAKRVVAAHVQAQVRGLFNGTCGCKSSC
jgi:crotonobetainyl-CoA:carnitine CoA-transferase CaiB-like acyl-CoA transferase